MKELISILSLVFCLALCGCNRHSSPATPALTEDVIPFRFYLPEPVVRKVVHIDVAGRSLEATVLGSDQVQTAFFIFYYPRGDAKELKGDCEEAINLEIDRCVGNVQGEIESRKKVPGLEEPAVEVTAKSSTNQNLTITCRVLCDAKRVYSLTAITNDGRERNSDVERFFSGFRRN